MTSNLLMCSQTEGVFGVFVEVYPEGDWGYSPFEWLHEELKSDMVGKYFIWGYLSQDDLVKN